MNKGKLIVFEGADGTGKSTQARLLFAYFKKKKIPAVLFSFPQYQSAWGKMVRRYLNGEFGDVHEVSPYLASVLYAGDRLLASAKIEKWLAEGKIVVCDRYVASNIAHQGAKMKSQSEKSKYVKWLEDLEFDVHKIPKPDIVVLLTLPPKSAQKFMKQRVLDIHEKDVVYQEKVAETFREYSEGKKNWVEVSNMDGDRLKTLQEVDKEVIDNLKKSRLI
ncbi:dTMP kinase [Candidatus Curtissbacteria bacterium]|nr:dTMP kinase [Candidatus Curtissbacteria bacterium]